MEWYRSLFSRHVRVCGRPRIYFLPPSVCTSEGGHNRRSIIFSTALASFSLHSAPPWGNASVQALRILVSQPRRSAWTPDQPQVASYLAATLCSDEAFESLCRPLSPPLGAWSGCMSIPQSPRRLLFFPLGQKHRRFLDHVLFLDQLGHYCICGPATLFASLVLR